MSSPASRALAVLPLLGSLVGCAAPRFPAGPPHPAPSPPRPPEVVARLSSPLDERPALPDARAFAPTLPEVFTTSNGLTVWLVERHTLPLVSATLTVPAGSAEDPMGKSGLAHITAEMLGEGAGERGAVAFSSAVSDLGATLSTGAGVDGGVVALTSLKKNFEQAFVLFSDVVARPRFDPKEWKRATELWQNGLRKRADDPSSVSRVVTAAAFYGPGTAYGRPSDGLLADARGIGLAAVKAFYASRWRPDRAVLVVVGDVSRADVVQLCNTHLAAWKGVAEPSKSAVLRLDQATFQRPRLVVVDRADAPQAVIAVVREGLAAGDMRAPLLDLVSMALGGSFTSRLNQSLREEHGWTYGVRSAFNEARRAGTFVVRASVQTKATGDALAETLGALRTMAATGLTDDELAKIRAQDRAEVVQQYETVGGVSSRLGSLSLLGLPPGFDAAASQARQAATLAGLAALAKAWVEPRDAVVVVVGPRAELAPQLESLGLGAPAPWDAEGRPVVDRPSASRPAQGHSRR